MSADYYSPHDMIEIEGSECLETYQFGDGHVKHVFCGTCGISPFNVIAGLPADYDGSARIGDSRINLGCVDELDVFELELELIDGASF